jgi:DNA processing protein
MNDNAFRFWLALKAIPGIGHATFSNLVERFGSPSMVFSAAESDLCSCPGINKTIARSIINFKDWDKISRDLEMIDKLGIQIITFQDECYPSNLLNIYDRPAFLYALGTLHKDEIPIAVVGSRRATPYGKYTAEKISRDLALSGITIVSGLARGIDSCAHRGALSVSQRTIAVLGCGLNVIYPPENKNLFKEISEIGAVISEFPLDTKPMPFHFPTRNRIISGMSYGVVVVEAGEKSGSLITARLAMEQGRDVFAIPGSIDSPSSRGSNSLIKQGAKLIDHIGDILEDILPQLERPLLIPEKLSETKQITEAKRTQITEMVPVDGIEQDIVEVLTQGKKHADDIIAALGQPPSRVLGALISLELKGIIHQHPGKFFSIKK